MAPRLSPLETLLLRAFAEEVRSRFGARVRSLQLFGSRARGEGRDDSDLDLLVLLEGMTRSDRRALLDLAADLSLEHGLILSPLVADAASWREDLPLGKTISEEGIPL